MGQRAWKEISKAGAVKLAITANTTMKGNRKHDKDAAKDVRVHPEQ